MAPASLSGACGKGGGAGKVGGGHVVWGGGRWSERRAGSEVMGGFWSAVGGGELAPASNRRTF